MGQGIRKGTTFEVTSDTALCDIQTDHIFNAYVGEKFRLDPKLANDGGDTSLTYKITPDLPSVFIFELSSTGVIEGTLPTE